jgi:hypothetical protein
VDGEDLGEMGHLRYARDLSPFRRDDEDESFAARVE